MDNKVMAKQMINFHKSTFDNTFSAMVIMQEQAEKMSQIFLTQLDWLPAEGRKVINEWISIYKKGRNDLKAAADKNFKKVDAYFAGN